MTKYRRNFARTRGAELEPHSMKTTCVLHADTLGTEPQGGAVRLATGRYSGTFFKMNVEVGVTLFTEFGRQPFSF